MHHKHQASAYTLKPLHARTLVLFASAKRAVCEIVGGSGESVGCSETLMFPTVGGVGGVGVSIRVLDYSIELVKRLSFLF